jgi:DNA-binding MarR family transcriptional regulator
MAQLDDHHASLRSWRLLVEVVARAERRLLEDVEAAGVSAQWFAVLQLLLRADKHRLPMSKLAREVSFTSGGFTKLADRMGREGLIDRRSSDHDRRVVYATLTPTGLAAALTGERAYLAGLREHILTTVDADKLATVADSLGALGVLPVDAVPSIDAEEDGQVAAPLDPALPDRRFAARRRDAG